MIGGDQQNSADLADRLGDAAEPGIHGLDRLDRGGKTAGMPDHVGIGVIEDHEVVFAGSDRGNRLVGELGRRHFRLQIVGRNFGRRHHDAILTTILLLAAAVEEISDVRIFLRLRHAQLRAPGIGRHLAEDVGEILRRKNRIHQFVQRFAIFGHAERGCEPDHALS